MDAGLIKIVRQQNGNIGFEIHNLDALSAIKLMDYIKTIITDVNYQHQINVKKNIKKNIPKKDIPPKFRKRFGLDDPKMN